LSWLNTAFIL